MSRSATPEAVRRSTASQSGPDSSSSIDVRSRNAEPLRVEPVEDLVAQVVGEQPVVAAEALDGAAQVGPAAQREGGEVETGGPALGPLEQHLHVLGRELETRQAQHLRRLAPGHDEVARPQLDQPALGAQAADREGRLTAAGEDDLRSRLDGGGDARRRPRAPRPSAGGARRRARAPPAPRAARPRSVSAASVRSAGSPGRAASDGDQPLGIVVGRVDREPRHRPRVGLQPVHEQRRLAVARGGDERG